MKKHLFEIIACIWLTIVGVQFVATYFPEIIVLLTLPLALIGVQLPDMRLILAKVDFLWAYGAMLVFLLVLGALKLMRAVTGGKQEQTVEEPAAKQRRSRR